MIEQQDLQRPNSMERRISTASIQGFQDNPRLLVVDDNEDLRELYRVALEQAGCRVGMARDGEQALEHYKAALADSDPYRVVLLDINLPGMKGQECFKRILEMDDTARVIITSGDRMGMQDPSLAPVAGILPKPFRLRTLVYSVASALDSPLSGGLAFTMASTA